MSFIPTKRRKYGMSVPGAGREHIIFNLLDRELNGDRYPANRIRWFYLNVYPNITVLNVEKPPCYLRKFSPDGRRFVAFSSDQTSVEVYRFNGSTAANDLLYSFRNVYFGHEPVFMEHHVRINIFERMFTLEHTVKVTDAALEETPKQLNRECSLFTEESGLIVGAASFIPDDVRPQFYEIYTSNEALTPNPRCPLEDISLHLIDIKEGRLTDTLNFKADKIYLSHNQGMYLYKDRLAVLSVQHQSVHIYLIAKGKFVHIRVIGRFCFEDDSLVTNVPFYRSAVRPYKDTVIGSLKHRLLAYLWNVAREMSESINNRTPLRKFYKYFDQFLGLRLWKMQLLDEDHLLLKYASEDVVILKTTENSNQLSLFAVYNMVTTEIIAVYENTSEELLYLLENFTDHFRNTKSSNQIQYTCSPSNNIYAKQAVQRFKQTIISARYGGPTEATRRLLIQLPISAQSYSFSPYLDMSLFSYDDKCISPMERPKGFGEHPIRFHDRQTGQLKFKMYVGLLGRNPVPANARRLVAFIFHPSEPFAISVQRTNSDYVVNFHVHHQPNEMTLNVDDYPSAEED